MAADCAILSSAITFSNSPEFESTPNRNSKSLLTLSRCLVTDGKSYLWKGNVQELKHFIDTDLKLSGKWSSPGGESKVFTSKCKKYSLKWYGPSKKKLILLKDNASKLARGLAELAYEMNNEDNKVVGEVRGEDKNMLDEVHEDMELIPVSQTSLIDYTQDGSILNESTPNEQLSVSTKTDHENGNLIVIQDGNETSRANICKCSELELHIKNIQRDINIIQVKMENTEPVTEPDYTMLFLERQKLEEENKSLKQEVQETKSCINELRDLVRSLEEDKASLVTSLRITNAEYHIKIAQLQQPAVSSQEDENTQHSWQSAKQYKKRGMKAKEDEGNKNLQTRNQYAVLTQSNETSTEDPESPVQIETSNDKYQLSTSGKKTTSKSTMILGDSMLKGIQQELLAKSTQSRVNVKSFPGASVEDMKDYIKPSLRKKPDHAIIHAGTNDLSTKTPKEITTMVEKLYTVIKETSPSTKVAISAVVVRSDKLSNKVIEVNSLLEQFCANADLVFLTHNQIDKRGLNRSGLHLNKVGNSILAKDFISHIKRF